jgi:hypothetical protein
LTTGKGNSVLKLFLAAALIAVLAVPFVLRPRGENKPVAEGRRGQPGVPVRKLVLISPH